MAIKDLRVVIRLKNNQLVERREQLGVTIPTMAALIGVNAQQYGTFENLKCDPVDKFGIWKKSVILIAEYYHVDPDELWPEWVTKLKRTYVERCLDVEDAQLLLTGSFTRNNTLPITADSLDAPQLSSKVSDVLDTLPPRTRDFLLRSFGIGCSQETETEIAKKEGLSRCRVGQIVGRGLRALRHASRSRQLLPFAEYAHPSVAAEVKRIARLERERLAACEVAYEKALRRYTRQKWLRPSLFRRWESPRHFWKVCTDHATKAELHRDYLAEQFRKGRVFDDSQGGGV